MNTENNEWGEPMSGMTKIEEWGKDHWSLFAYVETRCVETGGKLEPAHMRRGTESPTRLKTREIDNHNDFDVLDDLEFHGLAVNRGSGINPLMELTAKGWEMASRLRQWKAQGGNFHGFSPDWQPGAVDEAN